MGVTASACRRGSIAATTPAADAEADATFAHGADSTGRRAYPARKAPCMLKEQQHECATPQDHTCTSATSRDHDTPQQKQKLETKTRKSPAVAATRSLQSGQQYTLGTPAGTAHTSKQCCWSHAMSPVPGGALIALSLSSHTTPHGRNTPSLWHNLCPKHHTLNQRRVQWVVLGSHTCCRQGVAPAAPCRLPRRLGALHCQGAQATATAQPVLGLLAGRLLHTLVPMLRFAFTTLCRCRWLSTAPPRLHITSQGQPRLARHLNSSCHAAHAHRHCQPMPHCFQIGEASVRGPKHPLQPLPQGSCLLLQEKKVKQSWSTSASSCCTTW